MPPSVSKVFISVTDERDNWQQVSVLAANAEGRMTVDGPDDGDAADNFAGQLRRGPVGETRASGRSDVGPAAEIAAAEIAAARAPENRDREECHHDLRAYDQASGPAPEKKNPDEPRLTDDGRWQWEGLELGRLANRVADEQLAGRRQAEGRDGDGGYPAGGITPAMRRVEAELEHGTLVPDTEKFALKSPDRFKEKLAKMIKRYPDQASDKLASAIHDGIRYTFLFPAEDYTTGVGDAVQKLSDNGYDLRLRKSSWDTEDYRGVNSRWRDAESGVLFEVQFHTPESWEAKQRTHDIYQELCDTRITAAEREQLEEHQRLIVAELPVPPRVDSIGCYVKGQPDNHE